LAKRRGKVRFLNKYWNWDLELRYGESEGSVHTCAIIVSAVYTSASLAGLPYAELRKIVRTTYNYKIIMLKDVKRI